MDCLAWEYNIDVWEKQKHKLYMIVTQDPVNNSILGLHLHTVITKGDQIVFNLEIVECSSLDHDYSLWSSDDRVDQLPLFRG